MKTRTQVALELIAHRLDTAGKAGLKEVSLMVDGVAHRAVLDALRELRSTAERCPKCGYCEDGFVHGYCGNENCRHQFGQPVAQSGGVNEL